jgi:hypothetical protein
MLIPQGSEPVALIRSSVPPAWTVVVVPIISHATRTNGAETLLIWVAFLSNINCRAYENPAAGKNPVAGVGS